MTTTQILALLTGFGPALLALLVAVGTYLGTVAPWLKDQRVQAVAAQAVQAAEQIIAPILLPNGHVDKSPLFAYADNAVALFDPRLSPAARERLIESAVALLHLDAGTFTPAQPPAALPAEQTTQMAADFAALRKVVADLQAVVQAATTPAPAPSAATRKLSRAPATGQFAPASSAPLTISSGSDSSEGPGTPLAGV